MDTIANRDGGARGRLEALLAEREWLRGLARRLIADPAAADDLAQEALLQVLQRGESGGALARPRALLATILRRKRASHYRAESSRARRERASGAPPEAPSTDELVASAEAQARVANKLLELPEELQEVLLLRFHADLSLADIGRRLGLPHSTVRGRLERGLGELRDKLDAAASRSSWATALAPWALGEVPPLVSIGAAVQPLVLAASVVAVGWAGWGLVVAGPGVGPALRPEVAAGPARLRELEIEVGSAGSVKPAERKVAAARMGEALLVVDFVDLAGNGVERAEVRYATPDGKEIKLSRERGSRLLIGGLTPGPFRFEVEHAAFEAADVSLVLLQGRNEHRVALAGRRMVELALFDVAGQPLTSPSSSPGTGREPSDNVDLTDPRLGWHFRLAFTVAGAPDPPAIRWSEQPSSDSRPAKQVFTLPAGLERQPGHLCWIEPSTEDAFHAHLYLWRNGMATYQATLRVEADQEQATFILDPGQLLEDSTALRLFAVDEAGIPLSGIALVGADGVEATTAGGTGELRVARFPTGEHRLRLETQAGAAWFAVDARRGAALDLGEVVLRPWAELEVQVLDGAGGPTEGQVSLPVLGQDRAWVSERVSADGVANLRVPRGRHLVEVTTWSGTGGQHREWVEVGGGSNEPLRLRSTPHQQVRIRWTLVEGVPERLEWARADIGPEPLGRRSVRGDSSASVRVELGRWRWSLFGAGGRLLFSEELRVEAGTESLQLGGAQ